MAKIYAVANRKGGCSKTTTSGALAAGLSLKGLKVLMIDLDPQGNLTDWTDYDAARAWTSYEVLTRKCSISDAVVHRPGFGCDLLPADESLSALESELATAQGREWRLAEALAEIEEAYDVVIIDTPPQLSIFTPIALTAATGGVVVPTDNGKWATKAMRELQESIESCRKYSNPDLRVAGILLTKYDTRKNLMKIMTDVAQGVAAFLQAPVYETHVRNTVGVMEAQVLKMSIFDEGAPRRHTDGGTSDYEAFIDEFMEKEGLKPGRKAEDVEAG